MKDLRKAAKKALNVLETTWGFGDEETLELWSETKKQLRQALAQPKREWVGLTDDERENFRKLGFVGVSAVENKLKEKNG